jgi:tRNA-dihydrouridine synthase
MTHAQIASVMNQVVSVRVKLSVTVKMRIVHYRESWGSPQWELAPVAGSGSAFWTSDSMTGEVADEVRKLES